MEFQVIVLAGAHGQMLYPLAENMPKGLLPVANKPVIAYVLEMLEKLGQVFTKGVYLATDEASAGLLEEYIGRYRNFSSNSFEVVGVPQEYFGSIGALRFIAPKIFADCIVVSGDILMDFEVLNLLINKFRFSQAACTMLLQKNSGFEDPQIFGFSEDRVVLIVGAVDIEEGVQLKRSLLTSVPRFTMKNAFVDSYVYIFKHWVVDELFTSDEVAHGGKTSIKNDLMPFLLELAQRPTLVPLSSAVLSSEIYVNYVIVPEALFCKRISTIKVYLETNMAACTSLTGLGKKGEPQKPLPAALLSTMNNLPNFIMPFYANRSLLVDAPVAAR